MRRKKKDMTKINIKIFTLKFAIKTEKIAKDNRNTWGTGETPLIDKTPTQSCLLSARFTNLSCLWIADPEGKGETGEIKNGIFGCWGEKGAKKKEGKRRKKPED